MQTPLPAQIEYWMKIVIDKKAHATLKDDAALHLSNIRDTIDGVLSIRREKKKNESMPAGRHPLRSERRR